MADWEDRLDALWSHPPPDSGDKFAEDVYSWPYGTRYYVYEWRSFPYTSSYRYVVPQSCSDHQVVVLVRAWLTALGYQGNWGE